MFYVDFWWWFRCVLLYSGPLAVSIPTVIRGRNFQFRNAAGLKGTALAFAGRAASRSVFYWLPCRGSRRCAPGSPFWDLQPYDKGVENSVGRMHLSFTG